jgi:hypothetical protein
MPSRTYGGSTGLGDPIFVVVTQPGTLRRLVAIWHGECGHLGDVTATEDVPADRPTGPDRTLTLQIREHNANYTAELTFQASIHGRQISGSLSLSGAMLDPSTGRSIGACSGSQRFQAVSAPGRIYAGVTSQHLPVVIEHHPDSTVVNAFRIGWLPFCPQANPFFVEDALRAYPVVHDDTFHATLQSTYGGFRVNGLSLLNRAALNGHLGASVARGSYQPRLLMLNTARKVVVRCRQLRLSWFATSQ